MISIMFVNSRIFLSTLTSKLLIWGLRCCSCCDSYQWWSFPSMDNFSFKPRFTLRNVEITSIARAMTSILLLVGTAASLKFRGCLSRFLRSGDEETVPVRTSSDVGSSSVSSMSHKSELNAWNLSVRFDLRFCSLNLFCSTRSASALTAAASANDAALFFVGAFASSSPANDELLGTL